MMMARYFFIIVVSFSARYIPWDRSECRQSHLVSVCILLPVIFFLLVAAAAGATGSVAFTRDGRLLRLATVCFDFDDSPPSLADLALGCCKSTQCRCARVCVCCHSIDSHKFRSAWITVATWSILFSSFFLLPPPSNAIVLCDAFEVLRIPNAGRLRPRR